MNEDREAQRKAMEKREQLVEMKSVHWCVLISTVSLCHSQGVSLSDDWPRWGGNRSWGSLFISWMQPKMGKKWNVSFSNEVEKVKGPVCKLTWSMIFTLVKAYKTASQYNLKKCELTVQKKSFIFPPNRMVLFDILHHHISKAVGVDNPACLVNPISWKNPTKLNRSSLSSSSERQGENEKTSDTVHLNSFITCHHAQKSNDDLFRNAFALTIGTYHLHEIYHWGIWAFWPCRSPNFSTTPMRQTMLTRHLNPDEAVANSGVLGHFRWDEMDVKARKILWFLLIVMKSLSEIYFSLPFHQSQMENYQTVDQWLTGVG